jgi:hypothetical protein
LPPLDAYIPEIQTVFATYLIKTLHDLNPNKYPVEEDSATATATATPPVRPVPGSELETIVFTVVEMLDSPAGMDIGGIIDYVYSLEGLPKEVKDDMLAAMK